MKREYINITKIAAQTNISYDRLHRAFRYGVFTVFNDDEKADIKEALNDQVIDHQKEIKRFIKKYEL